MLRYKDIEKILNITHKCINIAEKNLKNKQTTFELIMNMYL